MIKRIQNLFINSSFYNSVKLIAFLSRQGQVEGWGGKGKMKVQKAESKPRYLFVAQNGKEKMKVQKAKANLTKKKYI